MKINQVEIIPVDMPYNRPFRVSAGTGTSGKFIVLKILTDEGFEGIGSGMSYSLFLGSTRETAMLLIKEWASAFLLGQDPLNTDLILSRIEAASIGGENWVSLSHIDYALYDLKGKILNVPVYELLGGICKERIPLEWIVIMDEPEVMAEIGSTAVKAGFQSLKMHVGPDPKVAIKRFKAVREAVGPDIPIAIDMVGVYTASNSLLLINELAQYGLNFVEDPVPTNDIDGLLQMKSKTMIPFTADRWALSVSEAYNLIKRRGVDNFHVLLGRVGGLRRSLKYTTLVEAAGLDYQICTLSNGIEHAAGAHFCVSRSKRQGYLDEMNLIFYIHGGTETEGITKDVVKEINGKIENGYLYPPKGPGLGVELNEEILKRCAAQDVDKIVVK
jgi:L-alanine-DL-glutamate epimerase-like enolase superfamily enzyme